MDEVKLVFALAPVALLAACSASKPDEGKAADPVAAVRTAIAQAGSGSQELVLYGTAEAGPGGESAMATQAEATVSSIRAPNGTPVGRGQVVAVLTPSAATALDMAKAGSDAVAANAALARAVRLRADGLVSNAEVETARAAASAANATRAAMARRGGTLVLRAGSAGTVQNMVAKPGDVIPAGTTVATIGGGNIDLRAKFGVDPAAVTRIHPGMPVKLSAVNSDSVLDSFVLGVAPQGDATTRLAAVYVRVPAGSGFGVGQALHASLPVGGALSGTSIPYAALLDDGGRSYVFVVRGNKAVKRDVTPGSSSGDRVLIIKGLMPGERVVIEGGTALEGGMSLREQGAGTSK